MVVKVAVPGRFPRRLQTDLIRMESICFGTLFSQDYRDDSWWWFAYEKKCPVGFIGISKRRSHFVLELTGVDPDYRGRGYHKRLMAAAIRFCRSEGATKIVTYCGNTNLRSANNMIEAGFRLYLPGRKWGLKDGLYFKLKLK